MRGGPCSCCCCCCRDGKTTDGRRGRSVVSSEPSERRGNKRNRSVRGHCAPANVTAQPTDRASGRTVRLLYDYYSDGQSDVPPTPPTLPRSNHSRNRESSTHWPLPKPPPADSCCFCSSVFSLSLSCLAHTHTREMPLWKTYDVSPLLRRGYAGSMRFKKILEQSHIPHRLCHVRFYKSLR